MIENVTRGHALLELRPEEILQHQHFQADSVQGVAEVIENQAATHHKRILGIPPAKIVNDTSAELPRPRNSHRKYLIGPMTAMQSSLIATLGTMEEVDDQQLVETAGMINWKHRKQSIQIRELVEIKKGTHHQGPWSHWQAGAK